MDKKYNLHVLETVARKSWNTLRYDDVIASALLERKISFLYEAEEVDAITPEELASVEEQSQEALSDLEAAIQLSNEIFGDGSNTTQYLMSLQSETPTEAIDVSSDENPKDTAKKIAQKAGSTAQIQKVVASINDAIKIFGEKLAKLPLDAMGTELQKLPDESEVKLADGNMSG